MTRLFSLTAPLFLVTWFLATPALQADPPAGETADRLNKLERKMADLETEITQLKELKKLPDRITEMDNNIRQSFTKMQDDIKALGNPVQQRVAKDLPDTTTGTSQIQLVNTWDSPVLVVLEGADYMLQPGQTRTITRRPGPFSYEVRRADGRIIQGLKASDLRAGGRPHMIEIYPR